MRTHLQVLAVLNITWGALGALGALIVMIVQGPLTIPRWVAARISGADW